MAIPFLQAKHFRPGPRRAVDLVVIHSAEIGESLQGAEALMKVCANNSRVASWHYAADADSITQSVKEEDIAFHAPGANNNGIGIELSGRASQSAAGWDDAFSSKMLARVAELVAGICARWRIPIEFVDAAKLQAGARGITTHAQVSLAFKKSDHTDPGTGFPMASFLDLIRSHDGGAPVTLPPPTTLPERPRLALGSKGTAVVELQRRLNRAGANPTLKLDGDFGPKTEKGLRDFQGASALEISGIAEAPTWAKLPPLA